MKEFLEEVLSEKDVKDLRDILDYSLDSKVELENLQEKISLANYYQSKLTKILYKLRLMMVDYEVELDQWYGEQIHNVAMEYDGFPELLKTHKDYMREIQRLPEYVENKKILRKLEETVKSLEEKQKELGQVDWKAKGIIDIHKIQHNIMY
jgi:hypothetical protein